MHDTYLTFRIKKHGWFTKLPRTSAIIHLLILGQLDYNHAFSTKKDENRINNILVLTIALNGKDVEKGIAALRKEALMFFEINLKFQNIAKVQSGGGDYKL